jgi:hypothetical protein
MSVAFAVNVVAPLNIKSPVFAALPKVEVAPNERPPASVRAVPESLDTVPPFTVNTPLPSAPSLPINTLPALATTPPLNVLTPPNVKSPEPDFVSANAPPKTPPNTTPLAIANVVAPVNVPAPVSVNVPVFTESPSVITPFNV